MAKTTIPQASNSTFVPSPGISLVRLGVLGTVTVVSMIFAAYIVTVLSLHEWRCYKKRKPSLKAIKQKKSTNEKFARLMGVSALAAAIFALITFLSQTLQVFLDLQTGLQFCDVLKKVDFTLTNFIFISVYAVLWLRQRSFYINKHTLHLTSCCTRYFSILVLFILFIISLINPVVYDATQWYQRSRFGCKLKSSAFPTDYHWLTLAIITLFFHASLLTLFAYPLLKHRAAISRRMSQQMPNRNAEGLILVIRRAFHLAIVCVVSDIIVVVVNVAVVTQINIIPQIVTNINILINVTMVVMTFGDWKKRLMPWTKSIKETAAGEQSSLAMMQTSSRSTTGLQEHIA